MPLEVEEPVVEEVALLVGTQSKGKGCELKVVEETEEKEFMICWYVMQSLILYKYL